MKWVKNVFQPCLSSVLVALMVHQLAAGGIAYGATTSSSAQKLSYDGETILRGVLFGSGPVAEKFPEIWQRPEVIAARENADSEKVTEVQNKIIDALRADDPTFFDVFAEAMTSGDHLRIQRAVENAGQLILKILQPDLVQEKGSNPRGLSTFVWAQTAVVALAVALVVAAVVVVFDIEATSGAAPLNRDMLVDWIATRLG